MRPSAARLGDVATFVRGMTFKPNDVVPVGSAASVACMRTKNVQSRLDLSDVWGIPRSLVKRSDQFLRVGDLLVSTANSWNLVGKCCWVPELPWEASFGGFISALRAEASQVHPRYLFHWFASPRIQATVRSFGQKTTNISNLNLDRCLNLSIPLPSIAKQRRIAAVLDRADELRTMRRAALAKLDTLTQAIFLDMFGDPASHSWKMTTVREIADPWQGSIRTGPFGSQLLHSEFTESGIPVLGIDNAVSNEFQWGERRFISAAKYAQLRRYTVRPGDVLITIMGTCGRCAVVPTDIPTAINTKHLCCITVDRSKCLPEFLHAYFLMHPISANYLRQTAKGAIMSGLNMGIIQAMPIPVPPLEIQTRFVLRVSAVDRLKREHRASIAELDALFASLQHRVFRGEL